MLRSLVLLVSTHKSLGLWLQAELDAGQSIAALRRFSDNLAKLPEHGWGMPPDHHVCLGMHASDKPARTVCNASVSTSEQWEGVLHEWHLSVQWG